MAPVSRLTIKAAATVGAGLLTGAALASLLPRVWLVPGDDIRPTGPALSGVFDGLDLEREARPVRLVPMVRDVGQPTDLAFVPGHDHLLVVASKWGSLHLVDVARGTRLFWLWLDVDETLEAGLLGFAFHPEFAENGRLFVHHVPRGGPLRSVLSELRVDPDTLDPPEWVADLVTVPQPAGTHNGGQLAFGPDGMLYAGFGDGEAGGDPGHTAQDSGDLLGSMLRLDVSQPGRATAPPDNPFIGQDDVQPAIFATGLRNPWRFTFAPDGRVVVADVGHSRWEEVNLVEAGDNLGWSRMEGRDCFEPPEGCDPAGLVAPAYTYGRTDGISITGGVIWTALGPMRGRYLFADFGTGRLWAMALPDGRASTDDVLALGRFDISPSAFTRAPDGTAWVADFRSETVFRIEVLDP